MPYEYERMHALNAVISASRLCRAVQKSLVTADTVTKGDRSPVTVADYGVQAVLSLALKRDFPNDPIVGEEDTTELLKAENQPILQGVATQVNQLLPDVTADALLDAIARCNHPGGAVGRYWTLDPIDGTKGFLRGGQYALALALIEEGKVKLGILACPNLPRRLDDPESPKGRVFIAVKGEGAFSRGFEDDPTEWKIRVDDNDDPTGAVFCESVESGHSSHQDAAAVARVLGVTAPPVRIDSQCKYGVVARGEASIYLRLPVERARVGDPKRYVEKIWDHAAGSIIVAEAGGRASDILGHPLDFSQGRTLRRNLGVIATNGGFHDAVLDALRRVLDLEGLEQ